LAQKLDQKDLEYIKQRLAWPQIQCPDSLLRRRETGRSCRDAWSSWSASQSGAYALLPAEVLAKFGDERVDPHAIDRLSIAMCRVELAAAFGGSSKRGRKSSRNGHADERGTSRARRPPDQQNLLAGA
jgi:hypothetical protein